MQHNLEDPFQLYDDLDTISLCNVIYKVVSKLQHLLKEIIKLCFFLNKANYVFYRLLNYSDKENSLEQIKETNLT